MITRILPSEAVYQGDLILVNAHHPCRPAAQSDLVPVAGSGILLERRAAQALDGLMAAIGGGWKSIVPVSGWRALAEQQAIWDGSLAENGPAFTRTYVAYPGCSEHQTGLAIDLGLNQGEIDFIRPAFPYEGICQAFRDHMAQFGFIQRYPAGKEAVTGIGHEPWHFRYVGRPHALRMAARGLTLEEYLPWLTSFPWTAGGLRDAFGRVGFLPASPEGPTVVEMPDTGTWTLSGNNADGFLLTEWEASHG